MSALRGVLDMLDVAWSRVVRAVLLGVLALGCSVALAATSAWLIARASQMPPVLTLSIAVAAVRAFGVGRGVFRYAERLASHDIALRGMANLRANLYEQISTAPSERLARLRRGDLLSRVGVDVDEVGNLIVRSLVPAAVAAILSIASVAFIWTILPAAAIGLAAALVLAGVFAPWLVYRASARSESELAVARAAVSSDTLTIVEDGQQLRVAGTLGARLEDLHRAEDRLSAAAEANANGLGLAGAISTLAQSLAVIAALVVGAMALQPGGPLAGSDRGRVWLAVIVITPMAAFEALGALPNAALQLRRSQNAAKRLSELLPSNQETSDVGPRFSASAQNDVIGTANVQPDEVLPLAASPTPLPPRHSAGPSGERRIHCAGDPRETVLAMRNASIGWPGAPPLFTGVNLDLLPGETLAVVGPSGIGKTTLLMTAAGLLPPLAGKVSVFGTASRGSGNPIAIASGSASGLASRSDQALFVAEDDHVFGTSVLENLRVARGDVSPEEAVDALAAAGLSAWLAGLPDGLSTMLGPDATNVSGGERRRLLVARAMLSPAKILLLDEPGEHLDPATADAVLGALLNHAKSSGRTVIVATHRPPEADRCDRVLHLG